MRSERLSNHSPASIAEVKNERGYTCTHFVCFHGYGLLPSCLMVVFHECSFRVSNRCFPYAFLHSGLALPESDQSSMARSFNLFYLCEVEGIDCGTLDYYNVHLAGCWQCWQGTWCLQLHGRRWKFRVYQYRW